MSIKKSSVYIKTRQRALKGSPHKENIHKHTAS